MILHSFSHREKIISILCLATVGFYVIYFFGYRQIKSEISAQQERIIQSEKELRDYSHVLRSEEAINQKLEDYKEHFGQRSSDEGEMTKILSDIEAAAQKGLIKIINMEPERIKSQDFYNYFSVNVQAQGSLKKICEFLYQLEANPYFFHIDEMRIEKYSIQANDLKCQLAVSRFLIP
jgi:Tfp pilus assembly protein PilO